MKGFAGCVPWGSCRAACHTQLRSPGDHLPRWQVAEVVSGTVVDRHGERQRQRHPSPRFLRFRDPVHSVLSASYQRHHKQGGKTPPDIHPRGAPLPPPCVTWIPHRPGTTGQHPKPSCVHPRNPHAPDRSSASRDTRRRVCATFVRRRPRTNALPACRHPPGRLRHLAGWSAARNAPLARQEALRRPQRPEHMFEPPGGRLRAAARRSRGATQRRRARSS